jgi:gliding motility-associated-like protein
MVSRDYESPADANADNVYEIGITATDDDGNSASESWTVALDDLNEDPTGISISDTNMNENQSSGTTVGILKAIDPDTSDSHIYSLVAGTGGTDNINFVIVGSELRTNAVFDFETRNSFSVRIRTTDTGNLIYEDIFTITINDVNDSPVITSIPETSSTEDVVYTYNITTFDDDGDVLKISVLTKPEWLSLTDNGDGTAILTGIPTNSEVGTHNVTINVNDGAVDTEQSFVIAVSNVNDSTVISSIPVTTATENVVYTYDILTSDDDGNVPVISADVKPAWLTFTDNGDGTATLNGTPLFNHIGFHNVVINADDGIQNSKQIFKVNVIPGYTRPVAVIDEFSVNEDDVLNFNILQNDIHLDGISTETKIINQPDNGRYALDNSGELNYIPNRNYYGFDTISYQVCINGQSNYCDSAEILINVVPVNDKPVGFDITQDVHETGAVEICFTVEDVDSEEIYITELIENDNTYHQLSYSDNILCFEYTREQQQYTGSENISCVVCDNSSPELCDTVNIVLNYQMEEPFEITEGISPNNDGLNDFWYIRGIERFPNNEVRVFNRWGNLIFKTKNYNNETNAWDGSINQGLNLGKKAAKGTYFYIIEFEGGMKSRSGYIIVN